MGHVRKGFSGQFFGRITQDFGKPVVDLEPAPIRRHERDADGGVLEGRAESLLAFPDRLGEIATDAFRLNLGQEYKAGVFCHSRAGGGFMVARTIAGSCMQILHPMRRGVQPETSNAV